jgi:hypothetical protein
MFFVSLSELYMFLGLRLIVFMFRYISLEPSSYRSSSSIEVRVKLSIKSFMTGNFMGITANFH